MTDNLFAIADPRRAAAHQSHRAAALDLLTHCPLSHKEAGFCGHCVVAADLTDKQDDWLVKLLARHGRLPLARGAAQ